MACPICEKRKAKRFCPAKGENICSICCGTEREVTIDCPWDCPHLVAARGYESGRREVDWTQIPFHETRIPASFVSDHQKLLLALSYAVSLFARDNPGLVDSDALAALEALAEAYRTLSSGIYYEKPPDYRLQRELYARLQAAIDDHKKAEAAQGQVTSIRDSEIRDALIFLTQLGTTRTNARPKGRAYLDFLRSQFKSEDRLRSTPTIVLP